MPNKRYPRFRRAEHFPRMNITSRDVEILRQLRRHRFLRSSQIAKLLEGSHQQILRRLQKLYHHGYLERPLCQLDSFHRGGSQSIIHALGNRGAALLLRTEGKAFSRLDWTTRNQSAMRFFLEHTLMVSEILVAIETTCRTFTNMRFRHGDEGSRQTKWHIDIAAQNQIAVIPDAMFAIEDLRSENNPQSVFYCLEADRGTMPVTTANKERSSIARKLNAYEASWRKKVFREQFGASRVQILIITNSIERLKTIAALAENSTSAKGLFRFSTLKQLLAEPSFFFKGF